MCMEGGTVRVLVLFLSRKSSKKVIVKVITKRTLDSYNLLYTPFTPTMAHCAVGLCCKVDLSLYFVLRSRVLLRSISLIVIE